MFIAATISCKNNTLAGVEKDEICPFFYTYKSENKKSCNILQPLKNLSQLNYFMKKKIKVSIDTFA